MTNTNNNSIFERIKTFQIYLSALSSVIKENYKILA